MRPAIRTPTDRKFDDYSVSTAHDLSEGDTTRQEFGAQVDTKNILNRYGVNALMGGGQGEYREVDYNVDLQRAYDAVRAAGTMFARLPKAMQEKYSDPATLLAAIAAGETINWEEPTNDTSSPETASEAETKDQ